MISSSRFDDLLTEVGQMRPAEQAEFVGIIQRRLIDMRRDEIANDIADGLKEFESGSLKPMTADELIRELKS